MGKKLVKRLALPAIAAFALSALPAQANQASKKGGQSSGTASAADAEAIFKRQCAMCHGQDGSGNTAMGKSFKLRDLKGPEVQKMTDAQLFDTIAKGKGKMPAYENNLGHDKIHAVVAYLRQIAKSK
jgi:cytochrome c oxidase cbb3-type subunit 3